MDKKVNLIGVSGKKQSGKNTVANIIMYLLSGDEGNTYEALKNWKENEWLYEERSGWEQKSFAHKVKVFLSILTGIPVEDMEKEEVKKSYLGEEWNYVMIGDTICTLEDYKNYIQGTTYLSKEFDINRMTVRQALQWIGTDLFRDKFHPNTWINALFADWKPQSRESYEAVKEYMDKIVGKELPEYSEIFPNWIVTDTRFSNEAKAIKEKGGILIRVDRYKSSEEWVKDSNVKIIDPDGWDRGDFEKSWNEKISIKEFKRRLGLSTISASNEFARWEKSTEHESETGLDEYKKFDYTIKNSGTLLDLADEVKNVCIKMGILCQNAE